MLKIKIKNHVKLVSSCVLAATLLSGCMTNGIKPDSGLRQYNAKLDIKTTNEMDFEAKQAISLMSQGKLAEATIAYNEGLKHYFTDSSLQLLNGINYHLRAISGDSGLFKLAEQGYLAAIRMDKTNWVARFYLGLLYLDMERYVDARHELGQYVLQDDADPEGLYYLAVASYYSGDAVTANSAAQRLWEVSDQKGQPDIEPSALLRLMSVTSAAVNKPEDSAAFIDKYLAETGDSDRAARLHRRIEDWQHFYKTDDTDSQQDTVETSNEEEGAFFEDTDEFVDNKMVSVDVVIIRTEEDQSSRRGINLLDGLNLQFGNTNDLSPGFSRVSSRLTDFTDSSLSENTRSIVSTISIPAVSYTLNILNDQDQQNEIIAQPTLVARSGQTSEFFSGVEVLGAAVSGGAGDSISIEKEIGVKLAVTPEFGPDGVIILNVIAERTFLTQPSRSVEFEFRLDTTKTTVNANVAMQYGQTLILSGLNERDVESNVDGVPLLKDVPGLNMFFSRTTKRNFNKSVIILLTPHPTPYLYNGETKRANVGAGIQSMAKDDSLEGNLLDRYETWYQPTPSIQRVLKNLSQSQLYRNFQSSDLEIDVWYKSASHQKRLNSVIGKLKGGVIITADKS